MACNDPRVIHIFSRDEWNAPERADLTEQLAEISRQSFGSRPPLFERVADALGSRDALLIYIGAWLGTIFAASMMVLWVEVAL